MEYRKPATLSAALLARPGAARPATFDADWRVAAALPEVSARAKPPPEGGAVHRFAFRLAPDGHWRMKLVAAHLGRSCQSLVAEALEAHIERLARQPGNESLLFHLHGAPAVEWRHDG